MIMNYFKITIRNMIKHKGYTLINITGLSLGLSICLIIVLFLQYHLKFDQFNEHANQIYRVAKNIKLGENNVRTGNMPGPFAKTLNDEIPDILASTRIHRMGSTLVNINNNKFYDDDIIMTDPSIFKVFTIRMVQGNVDNILNNKNSIIITKQTAQKYFPDQNPVGAQILLNENEKYVVTGIIENPPANSHLNYSMLINIPETVFGVAVNQWGNLNAFYTYILLQKKSNPDNVLSKIPLVLKRKIKKEEIQKTEYYLQALSDIHLKSDLNWELYPDRIFDIRYIYLFSIIGLFILLIGCFNYINLATAKATTRLKEVGVRKASGAKKSNLFWQFTGESILITIMSSILSLVLIEFFLPFINNLIESNLSLSSIWSTEFLFMYFASVILIGFLAGVYPSLVLSSFNPNLLLKGTIPSLSKGNLRKALVVIQFAISMMLIIGTIVIYRQLNYFQNLNLGLNPDQVLNISFSSDTEKHAANSFINKLKANPGIVNVSASGSVPEKGGLTLFLYPHGKNAEPVSTHYNFVDHNYLDTFGIHLLAGRNIEPEDSKGTKTIAVVNEALIRGMGWSVNDAIGKKYDRFEIIGVVNNFHYQNFNSEIAPALMTPLGDQLPDYVSAKLHSSNISETINWIKREWDQTTGEYPFQYSFLDQTFAMLYRSETRLSSLFTALSISAICIACLGLLGLMSFVATKKKKEISLRKVLGANAINIISLLSKDFIKLVMLGYVVAIPVAWYVMDIWLQNFAYRTSISWWIFALAAIIAFIIATVTVSYQAIISATSNPVEALRNE